LSTAPFKSLWAGVGACIRPDTDSWIIGLWKCKNINPLMETRKKKT
jgi:hypothetical protein